MDTENKLTYRVSQLERKLDKVDNRVDTLLEDVLPEVRAELVAVRTRINVLTAVNIGAIAVAIIVSKFL